jgi:hypothetical protein
MLTVSPKPIVPAYLLPLAAASRHDPTRWRPSCEVFLNGEF